jgi:hypothetical protein
MSIKATENKVSGNLNTGSLTNEYEVTRFVTAITQLEMSFMDTQADTESVTRQNINEWLNELELTYGEGMVQNNIMAGYGGYGIAHRAIKMDTDFKAYKEVYANEVRRLSQVDLGQARYLRNVIASNVKLNPQKVQKLYDEFDLLVKESLGKSLFEVKKEFIQKAVFKDVVFFMDREGKKLYQLRIADLGGKRWFAHHYAEMYARTRSREIEDVLMSDEMDVLGLDVVRINDVSTVTPICLQYENKYFSMFGRTPELPVLTVFPPFHPNCRHRKLPQRGYNNNMLAVNNSVDKKVARERKKWTASEKKAVKQQTQWNNENRS